LAGVAGVSPSDTIFVIDKAVEEDLLAAIAQWPKSILPVGVFAEGVEPTPTLIGTQRLDDVSTWLLIDPIDGTRGLMYDKRSAWFLAAAALGPSRGGSTSPKLSDAVASVAAELPTSKQCLWDELEWSLDQGLAATRRSANRRIPLTVRPSRARDLRHGFGSVVAFFAEGKRTAADLHEHISERLLARSGETATLFDDQYISTGGQMVELILGRDRFICDLRASMAKHAERKPLCAHPYDLAAAPLARAAGVILTDGRAGSLDAPFAVIGDFDWCGYANEDIASSIEPIVVDWLDHNNLRAHK